MTVQDEAHAVLRFRTRETIRVAGPVEIDLERLVVRVAGNDSDEITFAELKAVFFFVARGEQPESPSHGSHVTIEFDDGEMFSGIAPEYKPTIPGFYLYPEDEDRIEKVFIVASAIVSIDIDRL